MRTYERILPTLTFLSELHLSIQQIPTYEEVFLGLRDKLEQLEELQQKHRQHRDKAQETIDHLKQNEDLLRQKKEEQDQRLKEVLPKLVESEHLVFELRNSNEEQKATINNLHEEQLALE